MGAVVVRGFERLAGGPVRSLGSLLRTRRRGLECDSASRCRGLVAHRWADEYEKPSAYRTRTRNPSGGDGVVYRFHAHEPAAEESLLLLAVPGGNAFGASVEVG